MKLSIFILSILFYSAPLRAEAFPNECPMLFLVQLSSLNSHLQYEKEGIPGIFQVAYDEVLAEIEKNPDVINCNDYLGTPLTYALSPKLNLCTLPYAAQFLIERGAKVNQPEPGLFRTPLMNAVEAYGTLYGTPIIPELKNGEICKESVTEELMRGIVQNLKVKGANTNYVSSFDESVKGIAKDYQVEFLLQ